VAVARDQTQPLFAQERFIALAHNVSVRTHVPEKLKLIAQLIVCQFVFRVPVNAHPVIVFVLAVAVTVTVPPPEDASNITSSELVGTLDPPAPPEVADQCVVSAASQLPVQPTQ